MVYLRLPSTNFTWSIVEYLVQITLFYIFNESINFLKKEVIKVHPTILYGLYILL